MLELILSIIISKVSDHLWRMLCLEARVSRGHQTSDERGAIFQRHLEDIQSSTDQSDEVKNERLDNAARTLLFGVRKYGDPR